MKTTKIIKTAKSSDAKEFLTILDKKKVFYEVLDQDNICNPNEGYLNLVVEGMPEGESILFFDGQYQ